MDGCAGSAAGTLLPRLRVVTRPAQVLQVRAVHERSALGEGNDVIDLGARHGVALGLAHGTERLVQADAVPAVIAIATMRARQRRLSHVVPSHA